MSDEIDTPKRLLIVLLYRPTTFVTAPIDDALRDVAQSSNVFDKTLESVPLVNATFMMNDRWYICLKAERDFVPKGFDAVIFAITARGKS